MANYNTLLTTINTNIKANGNQEITGPVLNSVLTQMTNELGTGYQFAGLANPGTVAPSTDAKIFLFASEAGEYTHFHDSYGDPIELAEGELAILANGAYWTKYVIATLPVSSLTIDTDVPDLGYNEADPQTIADQMGQSVEDVLSAGAVCYAGDATGIYYKVVGYYEDGGYITFIGVDKVYQYDVNASGYITDEKVTSLAPDDELSDTSENAVQNKVVKAAFDVLEQYSTEETRYTDLITDKIYNLNVSIGSTPTLAPTTASGWSCVSFSVNAGDTVKIKAVGNSYSGRPYAILGAGNVVLKCAKDDGVTVTDTEMVMPEGAKTFYANFNGYNESTQGVWKYVTVTVKQKIAEVDNRSLLNANKIETIYGYFEVRNWISGKFYQSDVRIGEGASENYECCKLATRGLKEIHFSVSCPGSVVKCTLVDTEFNVLEQWAGDVNEDIYLSDYPNASFLYVSNYITNTARYVRVVPSQGNPLLTQLDRIKVLGAVPFSYSNPSSGGYLPANYINPLCFLHISDTHWHAGYVNTVKNAVELLNSIKINQASKVEVREILRFLIHTGDVVSDRFTNDFDHYKDAVLASTKPCFLVIGNHDVGGTHKDIATSGTDAQVFEKMIEPFLSSWNLNNDGGGVAHPSGKCYYFNDFTTEKIRMIVLDAYETNFEIVDGQLKYNRGDNGYTQDQITWFGNALVGTPSGYGVIVAKHAPCGTIGASDSPFNSSADFGKSYEANNDFIPAIVQAFKDGDNLSLNPISATFSPTGTVQCVTDFSQKNTDVEFVCHLNGHTHKDHAYFVPNYPTQLNLGVGSDSTYSTIDADTAHVEGTLSENLINAYAIDRNKGVIRIVRLGADISFEFQDRRFTQIPYRI